MFEWLINGAHIVMCCNAHASACVLLPLTCGMDCLIFGMDLELHLSVHCPPIYTVESPWGTQQPPLHTAQFCTLPVFVWSHPEKLTPT